MEKGESEGRGPRRRRKEGLEGLEESEGSQRQVFLRVSSGHRPLGWKGRRCGGGEGGERGFACKEELGRRETAWAEARTGPSGGLEVMGLGFRARSGEAALLCGLANRLPFPRHPGNLFLRGRTAVRLWRGQL